MDHVDKANQYIDEVLAGKIPAGKPMIQACQRQRDDLAHLEGFTFDRDRANHVCKFLELLPHVKGELARNARTIKLEPWQCFLLTTAFGWIDGEGNRRFRKAYVEVARKNAKALALDTPIPTPTGWTTMGAVQPGDQVIGGDGRPCNVTHVSEIFKDRPCYRLTFSNNDEMTGDAGHLWKIQEKLRPVTTEDLAKLKGKATIATAPPLDLPRNPDLIYPHRTGKTLAYKGGPIPEAYKRASLDQRQDLLTGLAQHVDQALADRIRRAPSDSTAAARANAATAEINRRPTLMEIELDDAGQAADVAEILRTLQGQPSTESEAAQVPSRYAPGHRYRLDARTCEVVEIVAVRKTKSVPTKCIAVDSPNHLFLAGKSMTPTHNSTLSSGVGLYCLVCDDEPGARVVSAATKRDQARLTLDDARQMVKSSPGMQERFGVDASKHAVHCERTNSNFVALSREASSMDGLNPSFVLLDEVHAYKNRDLLDVLTSAQGARTQPWLWMITTAGTDLAGVGREEHLYSRKVLDKVVIDERRFVAIFTLDETDDWQDPGHWIKANPNLGFSVYREHLEGEFTKASAMASAVNGFKTKHLNIWCSSNSALFDMQAWQRCADPTLTLDQFQGEPCVVGLDLASKKDFTAKIKLFERDGEYYVFADHYLPADTVDSSTNSQYQGWRKDGHLTVTDGQIVDYEKIQDDIRQDRRGSDVTEIAFDPFQATQLAGTMMKEGAPMTEVRQTVLTMSEPTKTLEALILAGKIHHDGDPVLAWCMSNVVGHVDAKDNVYPRRESEKVKIDSAIATIMALAIYIQRAGNADRAPDYRMLVV